MIDAAELPTTYRRAIRALGQGLLRSNPAIRLTSTGAVTELNDNLVTGVDAGDFEADFLRGSGNELAAKLRAAHSSAALAVNVFARFKACPQHLDLAGMTGFDSIEFEGQCPTGLGGTPPNLDLLARRSDAVVGVESKCTEHLTRHIASFSEAYERRIRDDRRQGAWFREMLALRAEPARYQQLDAAQLIKHAFGLARCFADRPTTLLYVFWEPANANALVAFRAHRAEMADFAARLTGASPALRSIAYPELWARWDGQARPAWLPDHLRSLRARYDIEI